MTSNDSTRDDRQHDDAAAPEGASASFPAAGSSGASTDSPRYRAAAPEEPEAAGGAGDGRGAQHRAGSYPATHDPATEPFRTEGLHSEPHAGSEPYGTEGGYPDHAATGTTARTMPGPRYPAQEHEAARYPSGDAPAWGAPAAEWNRYRGRGTTTWTTRKTVATAAIALAVTGGATAAAYGLSSAAGSSSDGQGGPGGGMGGAGGGMPGGTTGGTGTDGGTGTGTDGSGSSGSADGAQAAPGGSAQGGTTQGGSAQGGTSQGGSSQSGQSGAAGGMGASGLGMAGAAALHSESVVEQDGEYVSMVSQTGTIQKLQDGSLTVKSSDGYSVTYIVSSTSLTSSFSPGDEVTVTGTKKDDAVALKSLAQASSGTDAASGTGSMPGIPGQSGAGGTSSNGGSSGTSGSSGSSDGDSTDS